MSGPPSSRKRAPGASSTRKRGTPFLRRSEIPLISSWRQRKILVICAFLGCFTLVVMIAAIFGDQGMLKIRHLGQERAAMEERLAILEEETMNLRHQVVGMQTDPFFYEKAARERLGLVKEGEVIYDFRADPLARVP